MGSGVHFYSGNRGWTQRGEVRTTDTKPRRIRVLLIGEFEVAGGDPISDATTQLDAFREAVQPAAEYGITLYQATHTDLGAFAGALWVDAECDGGER